MKKKITALCLCISLIAIAVIGGTMAYFTDTDEETNTFTVGNVKIELVEKNEDGTPFTQNQILMPGEENGIVKDVSVKNIGAQDAYMWVEIWMPKALDGGNGLHFNDGALDSAINCVAIDEKNINGVTYNGYRINIIDDTAKATGEYTASLLHNVFMDAGVTQCTDPAHTDCYKLVDGTCYAGSWEIIVNAFGIQADGFENIDAAMEAYYGA